MCDARQIERLDLVSRSNPSMGMTGKRKRRLGKNGMGKSTTAHHPWPVNKGLSDHMAMRQRQHRARNIPAEDWFAAKLPATKLRWTRQARWGFRLFDFWCHKLGIAIEIDGPEHDIELDAARDALDNERSCILVLRVRNFNEDDAKWALERVGSSLWWNSRREMAGKAPIASADAPKLRQ